MKNKNKTMKGKENEKKKQKIGKQKVNEIGGI